MKVAVITRHAIANYGSLLQTMATQQVIENMGHSCRIIDYIRSDESYRKRELTLLRQKPQWYNNPVKRSMYLALRQPESILTGKRFDKYQKAYLRCTRRYIAPEELVQDKPEADIYLTGSDQVWGPVEDGTYDPSYCLSFTEDGDRRASYAASFGRTALTDESEAYYRKWLSRYENITVRESSAVEMLQGWEIPAQQVLDPTLLLDQTYWSGYAKPIRHKKYVLVYQLHNDPLLGQYAEKVAKAMGLPLIRLSATFHQISRPGKFVWAPDPGKFLSYIKNASCMVTDSFHGTAFAINFNTPFVEVLPNNKTGTRNMSILELTGLTHRILRDPEDISLARQEVDFTYANQVLAQKREESLAIFRKILSD